MQSSVCAFQLSFCDLSIPSEALREQWVYLHFYACIEMSNIPSTLNRTYDGSLLSRMTHGPCRKTCVTSLSSKYSLESTAEPPNYTISSMWLISAFSMSCSGCSSIKISVVRFVLRFVTLTLKGDICFHFGALLIDLDVHFPLFSACTRQK